MKQIGSIFLILIAGCFLGSSCQKKDLSTQHKSQLQWTSDQLKEYEYILEGKVVIPYQLPILLFSHLVDLKRQELDNLSIDLVQRANKALTTVDAFLNDFHNTYQEAYPLVDLKGKILKKKLFYWINRQLRYTNKPLANQDTQIVLTDILDYKRIEIKNNLLFVKYRVLTKAINSSSDHTFQGKLLPEKTEIPVPSSLVIPYYKTVSPAMENIFQSNPLDNIDDSAFLQLVAKVKDLLLKTRKPQINSNTCFIPDDYTVSPYNYYFYYDVTLENCPIETTNIKVIQKKERPPSQAFPEYHRLFAKTSENPKEIRFFYFINRLQNNEAISAAKSMAYRLMNRGYQLSKQQKALHQKEHLLNNFDDITLSKSFNQGNHVFKVRLVVAENLKESRAQTLLQQARKTDQVIIYDGHGGYNQAYDSTFYDPDSYQNPNYQIYILNGCNSFAYAYKILNTKALAYNDPLYLNLDVVSTFTGSNGHTFLYQIINSLEKALEFYDQPIWSVATKKELNWYNIIKKMNASAKDVNASTKFMVIGEEYNQFVPGKINYPSSNNQINSLTQLESIIFDKNKIYSLAFRRRAFRHYLDAILSSTDDMNNFHLLFKSKISRLSSLLESPQLKKDLSYHKTHHGMVISIRVLGSNKVYRGKKLVPNTKIEIFDSGGLHSVTYQEPINENFLSTSINLQNGKAIKYNKQGQLISGCLADYWDYSKIDAKYTSRLPDLINGFKILPPHSCFVFNYLTQSFIGLDLDNLYKNYEVRIGSSLKMNEYQLKGPSQVGLLLEPVDFYGYTWPAKSKVKFKYPQNHLIAVKTPKSYLLPWQGCSFEVSGGMAFFDPDNIDGTMLIKEGQLAAECMTKSGYRIPAEAVVHYDQKGWMTKIASKNAIFHGKEIYTGTIDFFPNPVGKEVIAIIDPNFRNSRTNLFPVLFHPNGQKKMAIAIPNSQLEPQQDQLSHLEASSILHEFGLSINSFHIQPGLLFFDPLGKMAGGLIKNDINWEQEIIPAGSLVVFNYQGPKFIIIGNYQFTSMLLSSMPSSPPPDLHSSERQEGPQQHSLDNYEVSTSLFNLSEDQDHIMNIESSNQETATTNTHSYSQVVFELFIENTDNLFQSYEIPINLPSVNFKGFEVSFGTIFYFTDYDSFEMIPIIPKRHQDLVFCQFFPIIVKDNQIVEATLRYPVEFEDRELSSFTTVSFNDQGQIAHHTTRRISYINFFAGAIPPLDRINTGESFDPRILVPGYQNTFLPTQQVLGPDIKILLYFLKRIAWDNKL